MVLARLLTLYLQKAAKSLYSYHPMPWHVYIIKCNDGKLYTGITNNLNRRIKAHNSGKGGRFTKCRVPVQLLFSKELPTKSDALKWEIQIKRLPRAKKLELVREKP